MSVINLPNEVTKDGRSWCFLTYVPTLQGTLKKYKSRKYATKKEAKEAESVFMLEHTTIDSKYDNMTFEELYKLFLDYKKDKVKRTTYRTYLERHQRFENLSKVKLKDFNIHHYEMWKKDLNNSNLSTTTKNHYFKFIKELLNFASDYYDFNFSSVYKKMTNFTNPNEMPKEMQFFTYDEFKKFISVEKDIKYKAMFEVLYFCGLRRGELRGLTWDNIDFKNKILSVRKNVTNEHGENGKWYISTTKTKSSVRDIPMPDQLVSDLKELKKICKTYYGFTNQWFVFGSDSPIKARAMTDRKDRNCKLAGVKRIRLHDFRHSCASLLINNGANITIVARYLGHTKIDETLKTYTHMYKEKMDEVVDLINNLK